MVEDCEQPGSIVTPAHRPGSQPIDHAVLIVNRDNRLLFAEGSTEKFIQQNSSRFLIEQPDIINVARRGLKSRLRPLLQRAWQSDTPIDTPVRVYRDGAYQHCNMHIGKLTSYRNEETAMMVLLHSNESGRNIQCVQARHMHAATSELSPAASQEAMTVSESNNLFLATMSHQVRTPMTAILGYTDLLIEKELDEQKRQYLRTINRNAEYLLSIINDLLDLSRIEAGNLELSSQPFSPTELMAEIANMASLKAKIKQIVLDCIGSSDIPVLVQSDQRLVKQIVANLLDNAIKFTKKGSVTLLMHYEPRPPRHSGNSCDSDTASPDTLIISVRDTGIGISYEQQHELFTATLPNRMKKPQQSRTTNLGLAISQKLAAMLGGSINCKSQLGRGSTFTLSLPVLIPEKPGTDHGREAVHSPDMTGTGDDIRFDAHILIADDRQDIRALSERIVSGVGARVTQAEDGTQVMTRFKQSLKKNDPIDLILMDMEMPNMDGFETAAALRKLNYHGPIIAVTAGTSPDEIQKCLNAGCDDHLPKPINRQRMLQTIDCYLNTMVTS